MRKRSYLDFVKNLSMGQKLGRVIALMGLPIVVLLGFFIWTTIKEYKFVRQELDGVEYLSSMRQLLEAVPQHRADVTAALNGDSSAQTRASQSQTAIDRYFASLDAANGRFGATFGTVEKVAQLRSNWHRRFP
jgi:methyl-accepting chemotaxis protein